MGRLAGFKYRQVVKKLKQLGFSFDRQAAGSHEIWFNAETGCYTTIPNHPRDLPEGTLRAILRQAGVSVAQFLSALPAHADCCTTRLDRLVRLNKTNSLRSASAEV